MHAVGGWESKDVFDRSYSNLEAAVIGSVLKVRQNEMGRAGSLDYEELEGCQIPSTSFRQLVLISISCLHLHLLLYLRRLAWAGPRESQPWWAHRPGCSVGGTGNPRSMEVFRCRRSCMYRHTLRNPVSTHRYSFHLCSAVDDVSIGLSGEGTEFIIPGKSEHFSLEPSSVDGADIVGKDHASFATASSSHVPVRHPHRQFR